MRVVATPNAYRWLASGGVADEIVKRTGAAIESELRTPWDSKRADMFNRCVVSPVTLNTLTKWAAGNGDNLALSLLCEAAWADGIPVKAYVTLNGAYGKHPASGQAVRTLKEAGVEVVDFEPSEQMLSTIANDYKPHQVPRNLKQ